MITRFKEDFGVDDGLSYTLKEDVIGSHDSGWTVVGDIHEDYLTWVEQFEARHNTYGRVWGDFDDIVYADLEEGLEDFMRCHPPYAWDKWDIE